MAINIRTANPQARRGDTKFEHVRILDFRAKESTLNVETRTVSGYASTPEVDSYDEVVLSSAFAGSLDKYMRNPVLFWGHDWQSVPIGKTLSAEIREEGLWVTLQFGSTAKAEEVWTAIAIDRTLRSMSIGFNGRYTPKYGYYDEAKENWIWTNIELKEISVVGLPACASAQFQLAESLGLIVKHWGAKGLASDDSYAALPLAPLDTPWDPSDIADKRVRDWADTSGIGTGLYRRRFLYHGHSDNANEQPGAYALPIADLSDGELKLNWRGVAVAMTSLLGARGAEYDAEQRQDLLDKLKRAYERFGKLLPEWEGEWPETFHDVTFRAGEKDILESHTASENARRVEKAVDALSKIVRHWTKTTTTPPSEVLCSLVSSITKAAEVVRAGRVLSEANRTKVKAAIEALQAVLDAADEAESNSNAADGSTITIR